MATEPQFAASPILGFAAVSATNTGRDGTGTIVEAVDSTGASLGGSSGARIERIRLMGTGDLDDSIVTMFIDQGGGYKLWAEFDIGNPTAPSATVEAYSTERTWTSFFLEAGDKIGFAITDAPTSGVVNCWVTGGKF